MNFKHGMRPVHPGEVLREDYLEPLEMSVNALAKRLGVPASRINDIALERRGVTPDTAQVAWRCHAGHRHATCAVLRRRCALLAQPPIRVRLARRRD